LADCDRRTALTIVQLKALARSRTVTVPDNDRTPVDRN